MHHLLLLVIAAGFVPFALAVVRLKPGGAGSASVALGSVLLATLAFNLTFFWQELWLVIPKALTPGLHPVLYHNDHEWTGGSPITELLQGTGAVATMGSGLTFAAILAESRKWSPTWQVFTFWMAFQGMYQSLSQFSIGAVVPGNDVGRALAYLGFSFVARSVLLVSTMAAMGLAGLLLAVRIPVALIPRKDFGTRRSMFPLWATGAALVGLSVPFRVPRNLVEVLLIPAIVSSIGLAWLLLGMTFVEQGVSRTGIRPPAVALPAAALVALLIFFQVVLRLACPFDRSMRPAAKVHSWMVRRLSQDSRVC